VTAPAVVVPNWNGAGWLPACLDAIAAQTLAPSETIVVDNGSTDGSLELLAGREPRVRVIELGRNTGFAAAANRGMRAAAAELVALVNTDVLLESDWLERMVGALAEHPEAASAACKMVELRDPGMIWDAGDYLRRDGAAIQRGRGEPDGAAYDAAGEVFSACAGAALYRRELVLEAGGFDERYFVYLEDVDLGLRLRRAGWTCRSEPAVARHAGGGSSGQLVLPPEGWVARNGLLLALRWFPLRWLPLIAYRHLGRAWRALRGGQLRAHLRGLAAALPLVPAMLRERRGSARSAVERVIPPRPVTRRRGAE
jgi:GT2 family glycosyltransferase